MVRLIDDDVDAAVHVEHIVRSPAFRRSSRHPRFLRYIVERAVAGDTAALREIALGLEIFDRDPSTFDPQTDPIVRVEAGRLRRKLAQYYAADGKDDTVEITLPVGSYVPVIRKRAAEPLAGRPSVAVLPFRNLTGDPGRESLCEALADALIESLGRLPGVKVIARTSAFQFKGRRVGARAIGEQLGVRLLLDSSLQESLERLTIVTQLIDTSTGQTLWSQLFAGTNADVPAIQETIAHAIALFLVAAGPANLAGQVLLPEAPLVAKGSTNAHARDLYERGVYLARHGAPAEWTRAVELFDEALRADPDLAAAHAERALALKNLVSSLILPADQLLDTIHAGIDRALALDPGLVVGYRIKAQLALQDLDWPGARLHAQRALEVAPGSALAHVALGEVLYTSGHFAEAEKEWEIAREFDPLHVSYRYNLSLLYSMWCRYERSEALLRGILDLDPDHGIARLYLPMMYQSAGLWKKALAEARESLRRLPHYPSARLNLALALAANERAGEARSALAECEREFSIDAVSPYQRAQLHVLLGETDDAFRQIDVAIARRTAGIYHLPLDPIMRALHHDRRWQEMIERHAFPRIDTSGWRAAAIEEWRAGGARPLSE
jgi:serine/threonine-protein kinase